MVRNRQARALAIAVVFAITTIVPVRPAHAVVPIAIGLGLRALAAGGAVADVLAAGVTHLIGGSIMALAISPSQLSDGSTPWTVRVPVSKPAMDNPDTYMPPPPVAQTAPADAYFEQEGDNNVVTTYDNVQDACRAHLADAGYSNVQNLKCKGCSDPEYNGYVSCGVYTLDDQFVNSETLTGDLGGCPIGYTLDADASVCNLNSPRMVQTDGNVDVNWTGTSFSSADKDSASSALLVDGNKVKVVGRDESGNNKVITVTRDAAGNIVITQDVAKVVSGTDSIVRDVISVEELTGVILGAETSTSPGTITGIDAGAGSVAYDWPTTGTGDIAWPTDYARTGEAAVAAGSIVGSINGLRDSLLQTSDVPDPMALEWDDLLKPEFSGLLSWRLPGHSGSCPTMTIYAFDQESVMSAHCQLIEDNRSLLSSVMVVVWTIIALFIVLGA